MADAQIKYYLAYRKCYLNLEPNRVKHLIKQHADGSIKAIGTVNFKLELIVMRLVVNRAIDRSIWSHVAKLIFARGFAEEVRNYPTGNTTDIKKYYVQLPVCRFMENTGIHLQPVRLEACSYVEKDTKMMMILMFS